MRTDLQVPFAEKDEAKRLGARWDAAKRVWYVQNAPNLAAFARWLPSGDAAPAPARAPRPAAKAAAAGTLKTGSRFFALSCTCLPWDGCPACRQAVDAHGWRAAA